LNNVKVGDEQLVRTRERLSQNRDAAHGFPFQFEGSSLTGCSSTTVARAMLNRRISRKSKCVCGSQQQSSIYEEVSVRLNRICGNLYTAQPERSSAVGLLTSGLLVRWSSHVCCSRVLICLHVMGFDRCFRVASANSTNKRHPDSSGSQSKTRLKT
jgi:hypothetical protein